MSDFGDLSVSLTSIMNGGPVKDATVTLSYTGDPTEIIDEKKSDESGQIDFHHIETPPLSYSISPQDAMPYSECTLTVHAPGFKDVIISGTEILPDTTATQAITLFTQDESAPVDSVISIPDHTLYGDYPPKIPEDEVQPIDETGEIVLNRVVIPEYIVVHDGVPSDPAAADYYIRYKDYIKNVVSSEIYATWTPATIRANTLAIMSFTLNRVYTEFYRNQGYSFTITSSTAYDQKWIYGRNTYQNINQIVDELFSNYLSRPGIKQPLLTQYCDGRYTSCPYALSQWGSQSLGEQGYSAIEILRYYYGSDIYINQTNQVSGVPYSYPNYNLTLGSRNDNVAIIQEQLNRIARNYPALPTVAVDGIYGPQTEAAVKKFQSIFGIPVTGVVDYATWYKISEIYVGVTRIAEFLRN